MGWRCWTKKLGVDETCGAVVRSVWGEVRLLAGRAIISAGFVIGLLLGHSNVGEGQRMHRAADLVDVAVLGLFVIILILLVDHEDVMRVVAGPAAADCARNVCKHVVAIMLCELLFRWEMRHAQRGVRSWRSWRNRYRG